MNTVCAEDGTSEVLEACADNVGSGAAEPNTSNGTGADKEAKGSNGARGANGSGGMRNQEQ